MKKLLPVLCIILLFSSCTSEKQVRTIALEYLSSTYNKEFVITDVDMNHNEGNWGKADIVFSPVDDPLLEARMVYSYADDRMMFENYSAQLWNRQIQTELEQSLDYSLQLTDVRLRANNSLNLNTMDLDYVDRWSEAVPALKMPRLFIDAELTISEDSLENFIDDLLPLCLELQRAGLQRVAWCITLISNEHDYAQLDFKIDDYYPFPGTGDLLDLVRGPDELYVTPEISQDFRDGLIAFKKEDYETSDFLFLGIYLTNFSLYRYNSALDTQSALILESLYFLGKAAMIREEYKKAARYYIVFSEYIQYQEVVFWYSDMIAEIDKDINWIIESSGLSF